MNKVQNAFFLDAFPVRDLPLEIALLPSLRKNIYEHRIHNSFSETIVIWIAKRWDSTFVWHYTAAILFTYNMPTKLHYFCVIYSLSLWTNKEFPFIGPHWNENCWQIVLSAFCILKLTFCELSRIAFAFDYKNENDTNK